VSDPDFSDVHWRAIPVVSRRLGIPTDVTLFCYGRNNALPRGHGVYILGLHEGNDLNLLDGALRDVYALREDQPNSTIVALDRWDCQWAEDHVGELWDYRYPLLGDKELEQVLRGHTERVAAG